MNKITEIKVWAAIQGICIVIKRGNNQSGKIYNRNFGSQGSRWVEMLSEIVYRRMAADPRQVITPFMCRGCAGWNYRPTDNNISEQETA